MLIAIWLGLLASTSLQPPGGPAPRATRTPPATAEPAVWDASFLHNALNQDGAVRAGESTCQVTLHGSQPADILLVKRIDAPVGQIGA